MLFKGVRLSSDILTGSYFAQSQVSTSPLCALMVCCAAGGAETSHILRVLSPTKNESCITIGNYYIHMFSVIN